MSLPELRPYQKLAITEIYKTFKEGYKRIMLFMATGAGKSIILLHLVAECVGFEFKIVVVVKRRHLIFQFSNHLKRAGIRHGILMASDPGYNLDLPIQVCSIDTLDRRSFFPFKNSEKILILHDEGHDNSSPQYLQLYETYPDAHFIAVSATPFTCNKKYDRIIKPIEMHELKDQGFLVPAIIYVPNVIDVSNVKVVKGEYSNRQLQDACSTSAVVGNVIEDWRKYGCGRKTLLFAVNIDHSLMFAEKFNEAGIKAIHCDESTPQAERMDAISKVVSGEIKVLCNVNIFSVGVDIPEIDCIIFARPTKSEVLYVQQAGRGLRPSNGKIDCVYIDNAGNALRHGHIYDVRTATTVERKKKSKDEGERARRCEQCFAIFPISEDACPYCGFINPKKLRKIKTEDGELILFEGMSNEHIMEYRRKAFLSSFYKLVNFQRSKGFKPTWVYYRLLEEFGAEECHRFADNVRFPRWLLPSGTAGLSIKGITK